MALSTHSDLTEIRHGEVVINAPIRADASLQFIGCIHTPWKTRSECPRRGDLDGPICKIEIFAPWDQALAGIEAHQRLQALYWMDRARRDLVVQSPRHGSGPTGTFALRSPNRPNPIASSLVTLVGVEGNVALVRGLDCIDGTPLLDLKPEHCPHDGARSNHEAGRRT